MIAIFSIKKLWYDFSRFGIFSGRRSGLKRSLRRYVVILSRAHGSICIIPV